MSRRGAGRVSALKFRLRQLLKPKAQTRKPDVVSTQTTTFFRGGQAEWKAAIHPLCDVLRLKYNSWGTTAKFRLKCRSVWCCASVHGMRNGLSTPRVGTRQVLLLTELPSVPGCCLGRVKKHWCPAAETQWKLKKKKLILCLATYSFSPCPLITFIYFTGANFCLSRLL